MLLLKSMNFDKESVGSNSSSNPPLNSLSHSSLHPHASDLPPITAVAGMDTPRQKTDTCFRCHGIGHWAKDCPNPNNSSRRPSPSKSPADHGLPLLHCRCGAGTCIVRVSRTADNPGRKFYNCPSLGKKCEFFKWCDLLKKEDIIDRPICKCKAGQCRIDGKFFVCPIKKGQGACSFRIALEDASKQADETNSSPQSTLTSCHETGDNPMLSDGDDFALSDELLEGIDFSCDGNISSPQSTVTNSGNSSPSNSDVVEEREIADPMIAIDPCQVVIPDDSQYAEFISELPRKDILAQVLDVDQESSLVPLRRYCKRQRLGALKVNGLIFDSTECQQMPSTMVESLATEQTFTGAPKVSGLASDDSIQLRQAEFWRQMVSAEDSSLGDSSTLSSSEATCQPIASMPLSQNYLEATAIFQALGFQGWCGRVVHFPSHGLQFAQPKSFFCGAFPNIDPIDVIQLTCNELKEPVVEPPPKVSPASRMAQKILRLQKELQNELLSVLESTDFHEHELLADEAAITFHALEGLSVEYKPLKEIVDKFISKAKSLAEAEESINSDRTTCELVERQKCKKQRLDEVARRHSETLVALDASNQKLEELEKEATRLRDLLAHAEEILDCWKAENGVIRTRFDLISRDKLECELSFEVASIEAEEAVKIRQQKEAELDVAKADLDEARSNLRRSCNLSCLV